MRRSSSTVGSFLVRLKRSAFVLLLGGQGGGGERGTLVLELPVDWTAPSTNRRGFRRTAEKPGSSLVDRVGSIRSTRTGGFACGLFHEKQTKHDRLIAEAPTKHLFSRPISGRDFCLFFFRLLMEPNEERHFLCSQRPLVGTTKF